MAMALVYTSDTPGLVSACRIKFIIKMQGVQWIYNGPLGSGKEEKWREPQNTHDFSAWI